MSTIYNVQVWTTERPHLHDTAYVTADNQRDAIKKVHEGLADGLYVRHVTEHTHHFTPSRLGTVNREPAFVLQCVCGERVGSAGNVIGVDNPVPASVAVAEFINGVENYARRATLLRENQPPQGSVVMVHGLTGTAYQRFYNDGLWHSTHGKAFTWSQIIEQSKGNIHILTWAGSDGQ